MSKQCFNAMVSEEGTRTYIPIPFNPNSVWAARQCHHVGGTVNGCQIRGPLELNGGEYQLFLGPAWRRDNGLEAGDEVEVELAPEGPLSDNVAPDIAAALDTDPLAQDFFDSLPTFYRNNYTRWIDSAKRPETRSARIKEMMTLLQARQRQK